jgi:thymidylate kinase
MPDKGKLIALEGVDDQALDSQAETLYRWLHGLDIAVEKTCEPTNGPVGTQVQLHRQGRLHFTPGSLALLLMADRLDHLTREDGILAWLDGGRHVLCVHYLLSSYARLFDQVPLDWHRQINARCRTPDLTLYLDAPSAGRDALAYLRVIESLSAEGGAISRIDAAAGTDAVDQGCRREIARLLSLGEP